MIFILLPFVIRIINAFIIHNSFTPDEHWQSSEVAYWLVYRQGFLTWEWEPCIALRSILHPLIIALFYWILKWFNLDSRWVIAYGPRLVIGSTTAAMIDIGILNLSTLWFGVSIGKLALFFSFFSWFYFYSLSRTYSNCVEALFNIWGIYFWTKYRQSNKRFNYHLSLFMASLGIAIRPTSVIFWILIFYGSTAVEVLKKRTIKNLVKAFYNYMIISLVLPIIPFLSLLLDRWFYQKWTFPMINFAGFNLFVDSGKFYGYRSWHFYFLESSLIIFLSFLPFLIYGCYIVIKYLKHQSNIGNHHQKEIQNTFDQSYKTKPSIEDSALRRRLTPHKTVQRNSKMSFNPMDDSNKFYCHNYPIFDINCVLISILVNIIVLSKASHKEYRLLLPFTPLLFPINAYGYSCFEKAWNNQPAEDEKKKQFHYFKYIKRPLLMVILLFQVIVAMVTSVGYLTVSDCQH